MTSVVYGCCTVLYCIDWSWGKRIRSWLPDLKSDVHWAIITMRSMEFIDLRWTVWMWHRSVRGWNPRFWEAARSVFSAYFVVSRLRFPPFPTMFCWCGRIYFVPMRCQGLGGYLTILLTEGEPDLHFFFIHLNIRNSLNPELVVSA